MKTRNLRVIGMTAFLLAVILCALLGLASLQTAALNEPAMMDNMVNANNWGRSDIRAYLNGTPKVDNTLPVDTTHSGRQSEGYYESQFSDAEYALVAPFSYSTNEINGDQVTSYATTDRFWLPSGNYNEDRLISWGAIDISDDALVGTVSLSRVIPMSYWTYSGDAASWLRGPLYYMKSVALVSNRGSIVSSLQVSSSAAPSVALKLDLSSIHFASSASAARLSAEGGSQVSFIAGSSDFGKKTRSALPDYGMYLKKRNSMEQFTPTAISLDGTTLKVRYSGGRAGDYVVVQAFRADDLVAGAESYAAVTRLSNGMTEANIDVSGWNLRSLSGYTLKVWMEDASAGASLASATDPVTFVGQNDGSIVKTESGAVSNPRLFAMKEELQTSWGNLASADDLVGANPTNQKIYLGTDSLGNPLQFWIAGRESYSSGKSPVDGDGTVSSSGEVMTLYQAKSVDSVSFSQSTTSYKKVPTLQLSDGQSVVYSGSAMGPSFSYTFHGANISPASSISYEFRNRDTGGNWSTGLPVNVGTYEVKGIADATDGYELVMCEPVTFTITPASPTYSSPSLSFLQSTHGSKLSDVRLDQGELGLPTFGGVTIPGTWSWVDDFQMVGTAGSHVFQARFTPTSVQDQENFDCSDLFVHVCVNVMPATPNVERLNAILLSATYGQVLGDLQDDLASKIGMPLDINYDALEGEWSWKDGSNTKIDTLGTHSFTAVFTPIDVNYTAVEVDVEVKVSVNTTTWGTEQPREDDGKTQYIDATGKTSIEVSSANLDENGILWLKEGSQGMYAWFGVDLSTGALPTDQGLKLYVHWLESTSVEYDTYYAQLDDGQKTRIEHERPMIFLIGVEDPDGNRVELTEAIKVYVQIGDDWDADDLRAYDITPDSDESIPIAHGTVDAPDGADTFGQLTLSSLSSYAMFDEWTEAEQAASNQNEGETADAADTSKESSDGNGAIVGLVIGAAVAVILGGFAVWFVIKKKRV